MKCISCGKISWNKLFRSSDRMFGLPGEFNLVRCRYCGLVRIDPIPTFGQLSRYYPTLYYSYLTNAKPSIMWRLRAYLVLHSVRQSFVSRIVSHVFRVPAMPGYIAGGKILDVGCGSGDTLLLLQKIGWKTYGIDIDPAAVDAAKKRGLTRVQVGSCDDVEKYPDEYFDVIRLYHVVEHLDDPKRGLGILRKKLKKNGELIIGTPNAESLLTRISKTYWYNLDSPRHVYLFSPRTLTNLLINSGFRIRRTVFCSGGGIVGTIQYILKDIFGLRIHMINNTFLVVLFYPVEKILDWFGLGDIFSIHAKKI